MTTLETKPNCQTNDPNSSFLMDVESSLRLPLDGSMRIIFTGYYNGFGIEIRSVDEVTLLYHMGCFGKGSSSRSKPKAAQNYPVIMRKRQFLKRISWYKKYYGICKESVNSDSFLMDIDKLNSKIKSDAEKYLKADVIDLVSSDENGIDDGDDSHISYSCNSFHSHDKEDIVVIVANSDSEDDDYFANLKPKCCINKIKLPEKLMLTTQESFFLLYGLGCLQICSLDNNALSIEQCWELFTENDKYFIEKYVVYHYFRSKGYIVKSGIKFGGEYLLYKEGPGINHADFIVLIKYSNEKYDCISMLGHVRVASTTVKEVLIAEVIKPNKDSHILLQDLSDYSVRELLVSRNIPITINDDIE